MNGRRYPVRLSSTQPQKLDSNSKNCRPQPANKFCAAEFHSTMGTHVEQQRVQPVAKLAAHYPAQRAVIWPLSVVRVPGRATRPPSTDDTEVNVLQVLALRAATAAVCVLLTLVIVFPRVLRPAVVVPLRVCSELLTAARPEADAAPTVLICPVSVWLTVLTVPPSVLTVFPSVVTVWFTRPTCVQFQITQLLTLDK